jgi:D-amino-acid dehydrogenase
MRVVVIGAGVIGVTTAYELAKDGHQVTVVEKLDEAAAETSFANAGLIAAGHAYAWASPKAPRILLRSLFKEGQPLRFRPSLDPALWLWLLKFLRQCTAERARINTQRKVRLCRYSQTQLQRIAEETGVKFDARSGGLLYLYRSNSSFNRAVANAKILMDEGLELRPLPAKEAARIDPVLEASSDKLAGAIYCPTDASGDARMFTQGLAAYCSDRMGVDFRFATEVQGFDTKGDHISALQTSKGRIDGDAYLLCAGIYSPHLASKLGVSIPIYPIKGYSVTMPIDGSNAAPTIGGVDEDNLVAYARFGERLRVTATAEFAGFDKSHQPKDFRHMLAAVQDLLPNAANYKKPSYWAGLRPMTPEGTPRFGTGRFKNVYFNTGHGHIGWTMSAGSARIAADLLARRKTEIDLNGMLVAA